MLLRLTLVMALGLSACGLNEADSPGMVTSTIEGEVLFMGPAAGAQVVLYASDDRGTIAGEVDRTRCDAEGRFEFPMLTGTGSYIVEARLEDVAWTSEGVEGHYTVDDVLHAPVRALDYDERRHVTLTPYTTLLVAAADARRRHGVSSPLAEAETGMRMHLTFDAAHTPVARGGAGALDAPRAYALLLDAFVRLADDVGAEAGLSAGSVSPAELLRALVRDASGGEAVGVFDGRGDDGDVRISGSVDYTLSPSTLRQDLAGALRHLVDEDGGPWGHLSPADVAALTGALTCTGSSLFPACDEIGSDDMFPPVFCGFRPEGGTEISGVASITVCAQDQGSGIARVELCRVDWAGDGERCVQSVDRSGDDFIFIVDTGALSGFAQLALEAVAEDRAGNSAKVEVIYEVRNLGAGDLGGHVVKGPAVNVKVQAFALNDGARRLLAEGYTDAEGSFGLRIREYEGPIEIVASDAPDHPNAEETPSGYMDEAWGQYTRWGADDTLSAVLPQFEPGEENMRVVVSPLSDLAWTIAGYRSRQPGGRARLSEYDQALRALGAHFGLEQPIETILRYPPASIDEEVMGGVQDAELFMLALACLSQQAKEVGALVDPAAPSTFTALDMVRVYRDDLANDAFLDGRRGIAVLEVEGVGVPHDPFRHDLAGACARWLAGDQNQTGVEVRHVARALQAMSQNPDPFLFGEDLAAMPFDDVGPRISVRLEVVPEAELSLVTSDALVPLGEPGLTGQVAGAVRVVVEASDDVGIDLIEVELPQHHGAISLVSSGQGAGTTRTWVGRLDTAADWDGDTVTLQVQATDVLGNRAERLWTFTTDHTPPMLDVQPANAATYREGDVIITGDAVTVVLIESEADSVVRLSAEGAAPEVVVDAAELELETEGAYLFVFEATDRLARVTRVERRVVLDTTNPTLTFEPSRYHDERRRVFGQVLAEVPEVELVEGVVNTISLWQTHWGQETDNPVSFALLVADEGAFEIGGAVLVDLQETRAIGAADSTYRAVGQRGDARRAVQVTDGMLGFDAVDAPLPAGTRVRLTYVAEDLAHNRSVPLSVELSLDVVPPPLVVRQVPYDGPLPALERFLFSTGMAPLLNGGDVVAGRLSVHNPHEIPVQVRLVELGTVEGSFDFVTKNIGVQIPHIGDEVQPGPLCWQEQHTERFERILTQPFVLDLEQGGCEAWVPSGSETVSQRFDVGQNLFPVAQIVTLAADEVRTLDLTLRRAGVLQQTLADVADDNQILHENGARFTKNLQSDEGYWVKQALIVCFPEREDCSRYWQRGYHVLALSEAEFPEAPVLRLSADHPALVAQPLIIPGLLPAGAFSNETLTP